MCLKWGQPPLKGPSLPSPPSSAPPPPASSLPPSPSFPTGSLGDCGDTGRVVFLSRRTEVFKRGTRGRKGSPCRGHTNSSPSWSQRGRLQTGNHKSPQPGPAARPGSRNAVVCGGRAETGSLVFVNKNGERQGGELGGGGLLLPALQPSLLTFWGAWGTKVGVGREMSFDVSGLLDFWNNWAWRGMTMDSTAWWQGEQEGWGPHGCCPSRLGNPVQLSTERLPMFTGMSGPGNQSVP